MNSDLAQILANFFWALSVYAWFRAGMAAADLWHGKKK